MGIYLERAGEDIWDYCLKNVSPLKVSSQGLGDHLRASCPRQSHVERVGNGLYDNCFRHSGGGGWPSNTATLPQFSSWDASGPSSTEADSGAKKLHTSESTRVHSLSPGVGRGKAPEGVRAACSLRGH